MTNRPGPPEDMADPPSADKSALRACRLAARRALDPDVRVAADTALAGHAAHLARGLVVAAYAPMGREPGGTALLPALAATAAVVLLPVLLPDGDLDWSTYGGELDLAGPGGFRTATGPPAGPMALSRAELVLVPALAVGADGSRLGRGGGSYDRALVRVAPTTPVLALLYDGELVDAVPTEEHDRPVTGVLLPGGPQSCRSRMP